MSYLISPSMLSADFTNLQAEIEMINQSDADWFHLDIMDGMFVPNITFGMPVIKKMKKHATKPFDVHLMIENPNRYIKDFADAGADILTVHYEACKHLHRTIQIIKDNGMKAGVALNPHTPVSVVEDILDDVDMVLIMAVNPGFGGQKFINNSYKKISVLKQMINKSNSKTLIQLDGGATLENSKKLIDAGVDVLVAGSAVFNSKNPTETITKLKNL
ncbi:MAG: ribulose-phosphate 3-epimerase [Bacteroidota bacterium]|nr:ribulose-phosphate 3-epimerase [Bacteroidota bacterium]